MLKLSFSQIRQLIRLESEMQWVFTQNKSDEGKKHFKPDSKISDRYWNGDWTKPPVKTFDRIAHWSNSEGVLYIGRPSTAEKKMTKEGRVLIPMDSVASYKVTDFSLGTHTLKALLGDEVTNLGDQCTYWPRKPSTKKDADTKTSHANTFDDEVAVSLSDNELLRKNRLASSAKKPPKVLVAVYSFLRNPDVVAQVLIDARGICASCGNNAPFIKRKNQQPYLEVHHKQQLSNGGDDTVENAEALCPNCHREKHFGE